MKLHFLKRDVQKLLEHTKNSEEHVAVYGDESTNQPGLLIVGDEGIYLISNGKPGLFRDGAFEQAIPESPAFVVYATECNPLTLPFEEWRRIKEESFGSDDGIDFLETDFIEAALLRPGEYIQLEVTEEGIDALY
ncbi:hypothetical protein NIES4071_107770 (plasmid) [Calothrix sp. NIES-4071]|nr:hypothetical protein NIES4071_107770 [Calothrix sp. NIES-4071]BAZ64817.1 hypothetical protein NIES4105_105500 [Calothrix sp. NIES-4105]